MSLERLKHSAILQQKDRQMAAAIKDSPEMQQLLQRVRGKPFWFWTPNKYRTARENFNTIIGLPTKNNVQFPLFHYEAMIFNALFRPEEFNRRPMSAEEESKYRQLESDALKVAYEKKGNIVMTERQLKDQKIKEVIYPFKVKHVAVLKAAGLGISELALRIIAWLCMRNDDLKGSQIVIFTGPRLELAVSLIQRLKDMFRPHGITFTDKETVCNLNGVRIEAFPSYHADSARGLPNISFILADEFSFFPDHEIDNIMDIMLRNVPKSNPYLLAISTPQKPNDAMDRLLKEPVETSPFKKLYLDWSYGVGKIYNQEDIDKIKTSKSFEREYNLKFVSTEGDVFSQSSIDRAVTLGNKYPVTINKDAQHSMGVDPGFGSSQFGVCVLEYSDEIIKVVFAEQYERSSFNDMLQKVWELYTTMKPDNIYIDGSATEFIEAVKQDIGEDSNWYHIHDKITWAKNNNLDISKYMKVVPVSFSQEGASMLAHCKNLLEHEDSLIAINSKWDQLITALRGAVAKEYKLNKTESPFSDLTDSFRLACKFFRVTK